MLLESQVAPPPPVVNDLKEAAGLFLRLRAHRDARLGALKEEMVRLEDG